MSEKPILLNIQDKIATITLNRPDRKNAINTEMVNSWVEILDECRDNDSISAIMLTGAGGAFCAGGDKANLGENNKIAVFSAADGGTYKYEENEAITETTTLIEIFNDVVIVQDAENNMFEVYMNNIIKPSEG